MRLAALAALVLGACSHAAARPSDAAAWQEDLRVLAAELPRRHVAAFAHVPEARWRADVAALDRALPHLDDDHAIAGLARLVAELGDGHTRLDLFGRRGVYPLALIWFSDGIYVAGADDPSAIGDRLVAIGAHAIDDAIARLSPLVARDNDAGLHGRLPDVLVDPVLLHGADLASADRATFVVAGRDGRTRALTLVPRARGVAIAPPPHLPLHLRGPHTLYWERYDAVDRLVYVQDRACRDDPAAGPFAAFAARTLAFVDGHPVDRVVIDLRSNQGGDAALMEPLIAGLAARPALAGRVFVIIGMHTRSSAVLDAMQLVRRAHARLVGGPSAGSPSGFGAVATFTLPHSHLVVQYSTRRFDNPDFPGDALAPDVPVTVRAADWFAGRDPAIDAILAAPLPGR